MTSSGAPLTPAIAEGSAEHSMTTSILRSPDVAVDKCDAGLGQAREVELRSPSSEIVERHERPVGVPF
jgi:hypothetical protein